MSATDYIAQQRSEYMRKAGWLALRGSPWDKYVFAVLTANTPWDNAVRAFRKVRGMKRPAQLELYNALAAEKVVWAGFKSRVLAGVLREGIEWPRLDDREPQASLQHIVRCCPGLGYCKGAFWWALVEPIHAPYGCLDSHMLRGLHGFEDGELKRVQAGIGSPRRYDALHRPLERWAKRVGMSVFPTQWALWDYWRAGRRGEVPRPSALEEVFDE